MALSRLRGRMPLVAFILLAVVCLALVGFACACLSDEPAQAIARAASAGAALPAVLAVWTFALAFAAAGVVVATPLVGFGRASPQLTQRFLF